MEKEFVSYEIALALKELGFDAPCFATYDEDRNFELQDFFQTYKTFPLHMVAAPTFSQAVNFLYICSNKQIDIELKASDTYEERIRKITKGCEDLRNLQNNKSN